MVATLFQEWIQVAAVKARREGSHSTKTKLCGASGGGGGRIKGETWGDWERL